VSLFVVGSAAIALSRLKLPKQSAFNGFEDRDHFFRHARNVLPAISMFGLRFPVAIMTVASPVLAEDGS
jgi:hypothetical protein